MKHLFSKALPIVAICLLASCRHYDEVSFSGTIVGGEFCQSNEIGWLVSLDSPLDMGDSVRLDNGDTTRYGNVIMAFQSPRQFKVGHHISGTFHIDNNFSKAHCMRHYTYRDLATGEEISLQEAIFDKVQED